MKAVATFSNEAGQFVWDFSVSPFGEFIWISAWQFFLLVHFIVLKKGTWWTASWTSHNLSET